MRDNSLRRLLAEGTVAVGSNVTIPDPFSVELMADAGMDFLMIDTEHSPISNTELLGMLVAARPTPSTVLVRVAGHGEVLIKQALDAGAEGVIVPSVSTREECENAVAASRYAPIGRRGFGPRRASRLYGSRPDYIARANDEIMVVIMLETVEGLENLDEILSTPGVDGVLVGPGDLAVSLGHISDLSHSSVDEAIQRIHSACKSHQVPFGIFSANVAFAEKWIERGADFVLLGSDAQYLDAGIAKTRNELPGLKAKKAESAREAVH